MLRLIQLLEQKPRTVGGLAKAFDVTPRTLWRDLVVIEEAGLRLEKTAPAAGEPSLYRLRRRRL